MKILLTGMTGFISTVFCQFLAREHPTHDVWGLSLEYGQDLRRLEDVEKAVEGKDIVFNFGALTHIDSSIRDPKPFLDTNIGGVFNVLEACRKHKVKLVQISSSEVYGTLRRDMGYNEQSETHPLMPHSPYAWTKVAQDRACYSWWQTYEVDVRVVRPFNQYGPYQDIRKMIPKFINQILTGKPITIYGDGQSKRDWLYVMDTVRGIWAAQDLPAGETVNLATNRNYTVTEVVKVIEDIVGKHDCQIVKVAHTDERFGHVKELLGSAVKAKQLMGWESKVDIKEGIENTYNWMKTNGCIAYLGGDPKTLRYLANG